jgi:azurin
MPVEQIVIRQPTGTLRKVSVAESVYLTDEAVDIQGFVEASIRTAWTTPYLSADDDPVLAKLWDNDDDAVFDGM